MEKCQICHRLNPSEKFTEHLKDCKINHRFIKKTPTRFQCRICFRLSNEYQIIFSHLKEVHSRRVEIGLKSLKKEVTKFFRKQSKRYKCRLCTVEKGTLDQIIFHLKKLHPGKTRRISRKTLMENVCKNAYKNSQESETEIDTSGETDTEENDSEIQQVKKKEAIFIDKEVESKSLKKEPSGKPSSVFKNTLRGNCPESIEEPKIKRIRFSNEHQVKEFHVTDSESDSFSDEKSNHVKIEESKISSTNFSDAAVIKENTYLDTSKEIYENYFDSVNISDTESLDGNSESTERNKSGLNFKDHGLFQREDGKHLDSNEKFEDWESLLGENFEKDTLEIISGSKFECSEGSEQPSQNKDEEIEPEMYEKASQFITDQTCLICDSNFESMTIVIRHVIAHHLQLFSESNMGQEFDSRTNSEIEEHDLNALSYSESLSQDNDQEKEQGTNQETFQVNDMDYYSGKEEDWESFIEENYKSNQNQPEKAKYSDINDSIILIDDDDEIAIISEPEESEVSGFKCSFCPSFLTSIQDMQNHFRSDHADENSKNVDEESDENDEIEILSQFSCKLCSKDFDTAEEIDNHISKLHSIPNESYRKYLVNESKRK